MALIVIALSDVENAGVTHCVPALLLAHSPAHCNARHLVTRRSQPRDEAATPTLTQCVNFRAQQSGQNNLRTQRLMQLVSSWVHPAETNLEIFMQI